MGAENSCAERITLLEIINANGLNDKGICSMVVLTG
jgi:hypothetical protein